MEEDVRGHLENHFQPYNKQLEEQAGLDLTAWV